MRVSQSARHLGINRRRIGRWVRLDTLPERNRMEPRPGMVELFRDYLQQRWAAGCRHGRTLLADIRERGDVGAFMPGQSAKATDNSVAGVFGLCGC